VKSPDRFCAYCEKLAIEKGVAFDAPVTNIGLEQKGFMKLCPMSKDYKFRDLPFKKPQKL
jgi:hypothetical protein